jgi:hypothetical protein
VTASKLIMDITVLSILKDYDSPLHVNKSNHHYTKNDLLHYQPYVSPLVDEKIQLFLDKYNLLIMNKDNFINNNASVLTPQNKSHMKMSASSRRRRSSIEINIKLNEISEIASTPTHLNINMLQKPNSCRKSIIGKLFVSPEKSSENRSDHSNNNELLTYINLLRNVIEKYNNDINQTIDVNLDTCSNDDISLLNEVNSNVLLSMINSKVCPTNTTNTTTSKSNKNNSIPLVSNAISMNKYDDYSNKLDNSYVDNMMKKVSVISSANNENINSSNSTSSNYNTIVNDVLSDIDKIMSM